MYFMIRRGLIGSNFNLLAVLFSIAHKSHPITLNNYMLFFLDVLTILIELTALSELIYTFARMLLIVLFELS